MSTKKDLEKYRKLEELIKNAPVVYSEVDLKTEMRKEKLVIISKNKELYARLLKQIPKEKVSSGSKWLGKVLMVFGVGISVMSFGLFSFIGVPMACAGLGFEVVGVALDDCKNYSILLEYDEKYVVFVKTKGSPRVNLPDKMDMKKLNR